MSKSYKRRMELADENSTSVTGRLLFLMKRKGVNTSIEIEEQTAISKNVFQSIISGATQTIKPVYLKVLSEYFDTTPDYILNGNHVPDDLKGDLIERRLLAIEKKLDLLIGAL